MARGADENLRKKLALAVRSIQWSYSICWSVSSTQPGVLEWGDGYYNGDIKTRKTVQAANELINADQLGLERSEQLRELYKSLSAAENETNNNNNINNHNNNNNNNNNNNILPNPQATTNKRPSVALSPEDLTDTEWYFLVCMSFIFNIGQGLPGRTLAKNEIIWLCNAHLADSKVFSRSLLAKSASIQTIVCFPYLGGVVEIGVTEHVIEDRNLIQHIKSAFLDNPNPMMSNYVPNGNDKDIVCGILDENMIEPDFDPLVESDDAKTCCSPNNSTNGFEDADDDQQAEGINGEASQVQSWQFLDDEISNCVHNNYSMNSSDCISQTYANPEKRVPHSDLQEYNPKKLDHFNFRGDDVHYQGVLSMVLKSSHQLILGPYFRNNNQESSFVRWKKERSRFVARKPPGGMSQRVLKKVLFEVPRMHGDWEVESSKGYGSRETIWRPEADEINNNHVLAERKRREKLHERFMMLGSLVPCNGKGDKVSLLDDTIDYLKELERRVEELESRKDALVLEARTRRRQQETTERTSDNYCSNKVGKREKPLISKRKACSLEEFEPETDPCKLRETSRDDITVSVIDKNALIELSCPSNESIFLGIMEAVSNLNLDSHTVQSTNADGILTLTIRAKFNGSKVASPSMIRQAIQRVIRK